MLSVLFIGLFGTVGRLASNYNKKLIRRWDSERELFTNHFYAMRPGNYTEFGEITQNKGHCALQGHSRSHRFWYQSKVHIRLAINTNLSSILHRFRDIALDRSKSLYLVTPLAFNRPDGRVPYIILWRLPPPQWLQRGMLGLLCLVGDRSDRK